MDAESPRPLASDGWGGKADIQPETSDQRPATTGAAETGFSSELDTLALAYREGDQAALAALHAALRPIIQSALGRTFQLGPLPGPLESGDLQQQTWILLAELVGRWDPDQAPFLPYVHGAFPWALRRYLRSQTADRRSQKVRVYSAEHAELFSQADAQTGVDGRDWDTHLMCDEVLTELTPEHQRALRLHFGERRRPAEMAEALSLPLAQVEPLVKRAVRAARAVASGRHAPDPQADLRLLVEALHAGAKRGGRLPGRAWVCARTGLSELRFARLTQLLAANGCIIGRSPRVPGRLAHESVEATLAAYQR